MQQHPIPQNIIGFQFKLVGDMTLKQFGYLAGGAVIAYFTTKLPYPSIFTYPVAGLLAFFGFALAFLPIEDRPLDIWIKNFFIAIFSPTQFIYKKMGGELAFLKIELTRNVASAEIIEKSLKKDRFQDYLKTLSPKDKNILDAIEKQYVNSLDFNVKPLDLSGIGSFTSSFAASSPPVQKSVDYRQTASISLADISAQSKIFETVRVRPLTQEYQVREIMLPQGPGIRPSSEEIQSGNLKASFPENQMPDFQQINLGSYTPTKTVLPPPENISEKNSPRQKNAVVFESIQDLREKRKAEELAAAAAAKQKEEEEVQTKLGQIQKTKIAEGQFTVSQAPTVSFEKAQKITSTPQTPKTANIICGVVIDKNNQQVKGAIVEIKNEKGLTCRTLKTNLIGQFGIATPLPSGRYTIHIEKEEMNFDIVEIILDNRIIEPILIKAR